MQQEEEVYFVTDEAGQQVNVCFEPLTGDDSSALDGDDWQGARFGDVWKACAEHEVALKLTLCAGGESPILGLVWAGIVQLSSGRPDVLRDNLLEASPAHRHQASGRHYHGIGRILVARLVRESQARGAAGRLLARPVQGSSAFYSKIGFVPYKDRKYYILDTEQAKTLLAACLASIE